MRSRRRRSSNHNLVSRSPISSATRLSSEIALGSGIGSGSLPFLLLRANGGSRPTEIVLVLGKPLTRLLATSGLFAAIIGLALQRMIADLFSGLALTVERPFTIGDWLE